MPPERPSFTWNEYRQVILYTQEAHTEAIEKLNDDVTTLKISHGKLETKSSIWGAIGGMIPLTIALIFWMFETHPSVESNIHTQQYNPTPAVQQVVQPTPPSVVPTEKYSKHTTKK